MRLQKPLDEGIEIKEEELQKKKKKNLEFMSGRARQKGTMI